MSDFVMDNERFTIRPGKFSDVAALPAIERSAALLFGERSGFEALALGPVIDQATHLRWMAGGFYLVAECSAGKRVGFLAALPSDKESLLVMELSVRRAFQRRGIGRAMLARLCATAQSSSIQEIWLETDAELPWNAPFYATAGFKRAELEDVSSAVLALALDDPRTCGSIPGQRSWMVCKPKICEKDRMSPDQDGPNPLVPSMKD